MDGKGVEGAALIRGEAEEEKGRRGKNGYNTMLLYKRREQSDLSLNLTLLDGKKIVKQCAIRVIKQRNH